MNRVRWAWIVVVAQVAVLLAMAGEREWIRRAGHRVHLQTMPIDPMDPMRGAYVRLNYEISRVPRDRCDPTVQSWMDLSHSDRRAYRDRVVQAVLREDDTGVASLVVLTLDPPPDTLTLRGRIVSVDQDQVWVRYGVEALFLQQEAALALEREGQQVQRTRAAQTQIAIGRGGRAVLLGHRWVDRTEP